MRVTIVTAGTRGDVQPYIALGLGLQVAGHVVRLATHANFEQEICSRGLGFHPLEGDPQRIMQSRPGQEWEKTRDNPLAYMRQFAHIAIPMISKMTTDCLNACTDAEAIVYSAIGWFAAHSVVQKLGVPHLAAYLQPVTPTQAFPTATAPLNIKLGFYNRLTYTLTQELTWRLFREGLNAARVRVLQLPPMTESPFPRAHRQRATIAYGYSPAVLPKPADWGDWIHVTGYWFLDATSEWRPPAPLVNFLQSGPPPVYVGLGSMSERDPDQTTDLVLRALSLSGQRGILASGWSGLGNTVLPGSVFRVGAIPHDWLFPHMAAVVHHGGSGTTAAGLRAGVPTVTIPFFADQPFWAQRVSELGVGPRPLPRTRLTAERLAGAIREATDNRPMRARAESLSEKIRAENGVRAGVEVFHRAVA